MERAKTMIQRNNIFGWLLFIMLLSSVAAKAEGENVVFDTSPIAYYDNTTSSQVAYLYVPEQLNDAPNMYSTATAATVTIDPTNGAVFYVILKDYSNTSADIASVTATVYVGGASAQARRRTPDAPNVVSVIQGTPAETRTAANCYNPYNVYKVTLPASLSTLTDPTIEVHVELQSKVLLSSLTFALTSTTSFVYNGEVQHPSFTLTNSTTTLIEGEDYTVDWPYYSYEPGNYSFEIRDIGGSHYYGSFSNSSTTYTINPKPVTVSGFMAANKIYDGTTDATLYDSHVSIDGKVGYDNVSVNATGTFNSADVGDKTVIISGLTLTGTNANRYTLAAEGQQTSTTASITPKTITVTSGISASNKTYDGNTNATLVCTSATFDGKISSDVLSVTGTGAFADKNVGEGKAVTISGLTLSGTSAGNYTLATSGNQSSTNANIEQLEATLSWGDTDLTFTGSAQAPTCTVGNLISPDECTVTVSGAQTNVGNNYIATATELSNGNYKLPSSVTQLFEIRAADATITAATTQSTTYDKSPQPLTASVDYGSVTIKYYSNAEHTTGETTTAPTDAGTYYAIVSQSNTNYSSTPVEVTYTINPRPVTVSGITANSKTYDGNTNATLVYTGVTIADIVDGDNLSVTGTGAFDDANVGEGKTVTISGLTLGGASASNYVLAGSGNQTDATANITAKTVTVSGITANNKVYDGSTTATLVYPTLTEKVGSDDLTVTATGAFDDANVGEGKNVTISELTLGGTSASNYVLAGSGQQTSTTADITAANLTITANAQTIAYGETITTGTDQVTTSGLVSGDALTNIVLTTSTSNVTTSGTITPSAAETTKGAGNYSITYNPGILTITAVAASVTTPPAAVSGALTYSGAAQELVTAGTGVTGGTLKYYVSTTNTKPATSATEWTTTVPTGTNADTYYVWYYVEADGNHTSTAVTAITEVSKVINPKPVTVSGITVSEKTYDGNTTATLVYTGVTFAGIVEGNNLTVTATGAFDNANVGTNKNVTISELALGGTSVDNYILAAEGQQTSAFGNITQKALTITAKAQTVIYGTAITTGIGQVETSGLIDGDALTTITLTQSTTDATTSGAITPSAAIIEKSSVAVTNNYSITYNDGALTINPKALADNMITLSATSATWTGNAEDFPTFTVVDADIAGNPTASDYTSKWVKQGETTGLMSYTDRGTYELQLTGQNNYTGSATKTFTVGSQNIEGATFTFTPASAAYKENASHVATDQTPAITVTKAGANLTVTSDYVIAKWQKQNGTEWEDVTDVSALGTYRVQIEGQNDYAGTTNSTETFTITPFTLDNTHVSVGVGTPMAASVPYDGAGYQPSVSVVVNHDGTDVTLREGTDYTVTYPGGSASKLTALGNYLFSVTGKGNYQGHGSQSFTITPRKIDDASIAQTNASAVTYNGSQQDPQANIVLTMTQSDNTTYTLVKGTDYSIIWDKPGFTDAGTYTGTIVGIGNFARTVDNESRTTTYTINPKDLADDMFALNETSSAWTGVARNFPGFTADDNGHLTGDDYTYKWVKQGETTELTTYTDRGIYELQFTGKKNYKGSAKRAFTVGIQNIEGATFTFNPATVAYKENASHEAIDQTPAFTVKKNGNDLTVGTDYETTVKWQKQSGTSWVDLAATEKVALPGLYRVEITGKGDYGATTTSQPFEVSKYTLSDMEVTVAEGGESTLTYNSAEHQPTVVVTVTHNGTAVTLREGTDYTITYPDGCDATSKYKAAGAYTYSVTGMGNYDGEANATFTITPKNYDLAFSSTGKWATFYNNEQVRLKRGSTASGLTAYYVTSVSATSVTVEEISGDVIPAQMPVLLNRGTATASTFGCEIIGDDTTGADAGVSYFVGVGAATDIPRDSYILVGDAFVRSGAGTLPANRCYLTGLGSSSARMVIVNGDDATTIETLEAETDSTDQWYTLDGRRIDKPLQKGMYIKNNKKVVIK